MLLIYQVANLIMSYMAYSTVVKIEDASISANVDMTEFLLCNRNPLQSGSHSNFYRLYQHDISSKIGQRIVNESTKQHLLSHEAYFHNLGPDEARKAGHQKEDFLLHCDVTFNGMEYRKLCDEVYNIQLVQIPKYFNCYQFSSRVNDLSISSVNFITHLDHEDNELDLSDGDFSSGSGLLLSLKKSADLDNYWQEPINLQTGTQSTLKITFNVRQWMNVPYTDCVNYDKTSNPDICTYIKVEESIKENCECSSIPPGEACEKVSSTDFESTLRKVDCMLSVKKKDHSGCERHCVLNKPIVSISSQTWPHKQLAFYQKYIQNKPFQQKYQIYGEILQLVNQQQTSTAKQRLSENNALMLQNFASVTLQFDNFVQITKDVPALTTPSLFASIGGFMNLFSGISMLFFMEIIDLLVKLCLSATNKKKQTEVTNVGKVET